MTTETTTYLDTDTFWQLVSDLGWGTKTTDCTAVKMDLMRRFSQDECEALDRTYRKVVNTLRKRCAEAGFDFCCDSWDDTTAHIVGLGKDEYEACLADPSRVFDRMERGEYTESFSYCIPSSYDFRQYNPENLRKRQANVAERYEEAKGRIPELDDDIDHMVEMLNGDLLVNDGRAFMLAVSIEERAKAAIKKASGPHAFLMWDGGDPLVNQWCVRNLITDMELAASL